MNDSDSGYSTYDVSPSQAATPAHPAYFHPVPPSINHATPPLFNFLQALSLPHHPPSLVHEPTVSPCASDGGFFSPHLNFSSLQIKTLVHSFLSSPSPMCQCTHNPSLNHIDYNMLLIINFSHTMYTCTVCF